MSTDSSFDATNRPRSGMTRGGLDRFLSPAGREYSKMPPALEDGKANEDEQRDVDCDGAGADEAVCEVEKAVEEQRRQK